MALSTQEKEQLATMSALDERDTRTLVRHFQDISGFTLEDLAESVGYSKSSLSVFLSGRYNDNVFGKEENTLKLRALIKAFIEQHPQIQAEIDRRAAVETADFKKVEHAFFKAVDKGFAFCINGDPGTGKTFTLKKLRDRLQQLDANKNGHGRRVIYVRARWNMGPQDLLRRICDASGEVSRRGLIDQLLRKIRFQYSDRRVVIIIDEAQLLSLGCLETVRELLDEPPHFGLIFAGSHDVENKFNQIQMEQWRRRLKNAIVLEGLQRDEAAQLIATEIPNAPKRVVDELIKRSMATSVRRFDGARQPVKYLSAGNLASAIEETKFARAQRKGVTA